MTRKSSPRVRRALSGQPDLISVPNTPRESRESLQRRLALLGKSLALACIASSGAFAVVGSLMPRSASLWHLAISTAAWSQLRAAPIFGILWLVCRSGDRSLQALKTMDIATVVVAGTTYAFGVHRSASHAFTAYVATPPTPVFVALLCILAVLLVRAMVVPSSPGRTLAVSAAASLPTLVEICRSTLASAHLEAFSTPATVFGLMWVTVIVAVCTLASRVIFGLRQSVRDARKIGQYTLLECIGRGGMGVVYKAEHALLRRPTAVKILPPEKVGQGSIRRFMREVAMTSRLTHPNTIAVYDFGTSTDGVFYYAMEYLDEITLKELVELSGPLPAIRVAYLARQIAGSLEEAHSLGLVHRDIKPENIIVSDRGGTCDWVKVLDFGLVKDTRADAEGSSVLSEAGSIMGTPRYIAPEAIASPQNVGPSSDIYSLGALMYFLLVGQPVFEGRTSLEVCYQHLFAKPSPPSSVLGRDVPRALEDVVMSCLAKHPNERPPSAGAIEQVLSRPLDGETWTQSDARAWWHEQLGVLVSRKEPTALLNTTLNPHLSWG